MALNYMFSNMRALVYDIHHNIFSVYHKFNIIISKIYEYAYMRTLALFASVRIYKIYSYIHELVNSTIILN